LIEIKLASISADLGTWCVPGKGGQHVQYRTIERIRVLGRNRAPDLAGAPIGTRGGRDDTGQKRPTILYEMRRSFVDRSSALGAGRCLRGHHPEREIRPGVHVNYAETVLPMKDGLPKLKDYPAEMGGSGIVLPE
jgi:hypothetical protein